MFKDIRKPEKTQSSGIRIDCGEMRPHTRHKYCDLVADLAAFAAVVIGGNRFTIKHFKPQNNNHLLV